MTESVETRKFVLITHHDISITLRPAKNI